MREICRRQKQKDHVIEGSCENKEWIWFSILLVGVAIIIFGLLRDCGWIKIGINSEMRYTLWQASETICNIIVTYSTMVAAIVVFFYSIIDNKRLGIPNRRFIAYTIGSHTIPILFMFTLLLTVFMVIVRYAQWKYTMYLCAIYILVIQVYVIIQILMSTSYKHCKKIICQVEEKRYISGAEPEEIYSIGYSFGHLERAIHSEEFIPNKKELLIEFLWIPFRNMREPNGKGSKKKQDIKTDDQERVYRFYFVNILSAFQDFNGASKHFERNQLYICIMHFLKDFYNNNISEIEGGGRLLYVYHILLSGIMNAMISSNVEENAEFCKRVLLDCIPDAHIAKNQLYLFVLFQEILEWCGTERVSKGIKIRAFKNWELLKEEDIAFCATFWAIWMKMYKFPISVKLKHFDAAIQTMMGRHNMSVRIFEMFLQ